MAEQALLVDGLRFAEAPRWIGERLWFSDVHAYQLKTVTGDGTVSVIVDVPGRPSGLGALPDGRILMATALDRRLVAVSQPGSMSALADLSDLATGLLNDMVVDGYGRAYIGDTGFNLAAGDAPGPGRIILWREGGRPRTVAEDVVFPNGCVITPDGSALIICETIAQRITRYRITEDGSLTDREIFAELGTPPDGLCLDVEGAVWAGLPHAGEFVRILPGGSVTDRIRSRFPFAVACALGGADRRQLFLCSADTDLPRLARGETTGRIDVIDVGVPGAGWP
jgi:sugar lactone lactonase YvrE